MSGHDPALLTVLLSTTNKGKIAEIREALSELPIEVIATSDTGLNLSVVEDGSTFESNALKKARAWSKALTIVAIADDSGLEVDALGGRPGVRSARYAKEGATDAENNEALLRALSEVDDEERTARFRCVLAVVDPWTSREYVVDGRCEGMIARTAVGSKGFGYDPLFVVKAAGKTMAELSIEEKNRISHRGEALQKLRPILVELLNEKLGIT